VNLKVESIFLLEMGVELASQGLKKKAGSME
jgi:hypothetical protein